MRTIYPLQKALDDFLLNELQKQKLLKLENITDENTILTDNGEMTPYQFLSGLEHAKNMRKTSEARLLSFLNTFVCAKKQDVQNFLQADTYSPPSPF